MFGEQRVDPREPLALPIKLGDGRTAFTRDISASGMNIEVQGAYTMSGPVVFEMPFAELGVRFMAEGEIVRVERHATHTCFAIRLYHPRFEALVTAPF